MWAVILRVVLYVAIIVAPVIMSAFLHTDDLDPFPVELATRLALLGFSIVAMQFVLSARIKWVERPFGLDQIFRFHKSMAVVAACFLITHPVLLASQGSWKLLTSFEQPIPIIIGKSALLLLLVLAVVSIFRKALRLDYQKWLVVHNIVALTVLGLACFHVYIFSEELETTVVRSMLAAILLLGVGAYIKHTFIDPLIAKRNAFVVLNVRNETPHVCTLELAPAEGGNIPDYMPGQFHFLTLYRKCCRKTEEHPFTISSSPAQKSFVASTIKASGDYSSTIVSTQPGDRAVIQGPFGRFSYVLYPNERDLVFISGGIGITPLMSMLRHMRDTKADIKVQLLCFNRTENDITFHNELAGMELDGIPKLSVTHILSTPDSSWQGEKGHPDRSLLARLLEDDYSSKAYYLCGPSPMMQVVIKALLDMGVPESKIRYEYFGL